MEYFVDEKLEFKNVPWQNPDNSTVGEESYFVAFIDPAITGSASGLNNFKSFFDRDAVLGRARGINLLHQAVSQVELYPLSGDRPLIFSQEDNFWLQSQLLRRVWAFNLEPDRMSDPNVLIPVEELDAGGMTVKYLKDQASLILAEESRQNLDPYLKFFKEEPDKTIKRVLRLAALRKKAMQYISVESFPEVEGREVSLFGLDKISLFGSGGFDPEAFFNAQDLVWFKQYLDQQRCQMRRGGLKIVGV